MATLATKQVAPGDATMLDIAALRVAASAGGDKVRPGPNVFLEVNNGGGSPITVTVNDPNSRGPVGANAFDGDLVKSVAAGKLAYIGPLTAERFADPSDGLAAITYSGVTTVTVVAIST
jgi:hypothetical protein